MPSMLKVRPVRVLVILLSVIGVSLIDAVRVRGAEDVVIAERGMVVSVSAPASEVGRDILKQGGNAVDAAVATALALAVTHPAAGNIGGGGFMLIHPAPGSNELPICIDYREVAPLSSTRDMYANTPNALGHKAVGVPGTLRGLELAHQKYGKLPWKSLVLPAVKLAADGFAIDAYLAKEFNRVNREGSWARFEEFRRVISPPHSSSEWKAGDIWRQPDLARTMTHIAEQGADAFYTGPVADLLIAEMESGGGFITKADLAGYTAKTRVPIHGTYRGYDVFGPPPPSSGGICLLQMLKMLERYDLKSQGRWSPDTVHLMVEAMRRAYADRARYLADPDFVDIPKDLLTEDHITQLVSNIDPTKATPSAAVAPDIPLVPEGTSTTHFSVIDATGMAVSNTYTLEASYGSRVMVRGGGFLLNNEMGDFNWHPGKTTTTGQIGTLPNQIEPGKRMISSMTPTIVAREGKVLLVTGSPGGRTIINTVLQVVLNVVEFEMSPRNAVDAPRIHHQWFPDEIRLEGRMSAENAGLISILEERGHRVSKTSSRQGDAHTIWIDPQTGQYHGIADKRISGHAAGW